MKKIFSVIILVVSLSVVSILTGCTGEVEPVITNTLSIQACMQEASVKGSVKGSNLTYYYKGPEDLSLYYVTSWKRGVVSLRKYYVNKEKYELEKSMYPNATRYNDKTLMIYIRDYTTVEDMDSYWTQIENSSTYTIVK